MPDRLNLAPPLQAQARVRHIASAADAWQQTLVVHFPQQRPCLSTSDGWMMARAISNHAAHHAYWAGLGAAAPAYLADMRQRVARELDVAPDEVAQLATAVSLDKLALVTRGHDDLMACALVSAGVHTNALRAGLDEGQHVEARPAMGTINILLLTNIQLSAAALAASLITITEAKTAALQDLAVASSYTPGVLATGTGTDGIIVVSGTAAPAVRYAGGHTRIGSLMAQAVHAAVTSSLTAP